jgi:hypothetical protein
MLRRGTSISTSTNTNEEVEMEMEIATAMMTTMGLMMMTCSQHDSRTAQHTAYRYSRWH